MCGSDSRVANKVGLSVVRLSNLKDDRTRLTTNVMRRKSPRSGKAQCSRIMPRENNLIFYVHPKTVTVFNVDTINCLSDLQNHSKSLIMMLFNKAHNVPK